MTNAQLVALIIREGLPAALKIVSILRAPNEEVSDETIARLSELSSRTAADYEQERQD